MYNMIEMIRIHKSQPISQSEMQMRLTEQDNIDLHNKISEHQGKSQSLLDTLAKFETRLEEQSEAFEAMENDKSDWEIEKRKMKEIVSIIETNCAMENIGNILMGRPQIFGLFSTPCPHSTTIIVTTITTPTCTNQRINC